MMVVVWKYRVAAGKASAFGRAYGPDGPWVQLFSESPDYEGTELLRGTDGAWLTIDRWMSADAYDSFITLHRTEYARIDEACAELTEEEALVGRFEVV
jgi:hypothetical protein